MINDFLPAPRRHDPPWLADMRARWSRQEYFEVHEVLENVWRTARGNERRLLGGLIHAAVALHLLQEGRCLGALRQQLRARAKLALVGEDARGWDLRALLELLDQELAPCRERVNAAARNGLTELERQLASRPPRP